MMTSHDIRFRSSRQEDLAHLAGHLAESTRMLSEQASRMEAFSDEAL